MSLHQAAQYLAAQGRGPDTTLVHMTPGEVQGLQALARAHGGTLTVNPETGLPEAGFLKALLPMLAGMVLGPAGIGLTALQSGMAVGALGTAMTGSLKQGLMAGLGAYGGAGLANAVMNVGTGALSSGAAGAAGAAPFAGTAADIAQFADVGMGAPAATAMPVAPQTVLTPSALSPLPPASADIGTAQTMIRPLGMPPQGVGPANVSTVTPNPQIAPPQAPAPTLSPAEQQFANVGSDREIADINRVTNRLASATPMDKLKAGFEAVSKQPSLLFNKANLTNLGMAAAPVMLAGGQVKAQPDAQGNILYYNFDNATNQWTLLGSVPAADVSKAGGYEAGRALIGKARGGLAAAFANGGVARYDEGGKVYVPMVGWVDSETDRVLAPEPAPSAEPAFDFGALSSGLNFAGAPTPPPPAAASAAPTPGPVLFGAAPTSYIPAGTAGGPGITVGGYEPGYVAPPYDASKDPGNWFANPPAGPSFKPYQPGETEGQYFARLREYYETPEGQQYQAQQIADRTAAVEAIRQQYGLTGGGAGTTPVTGPGTPPPVTGPAPAPTPGTPAPPPISVPPPGAPTPPSVPPTPGMPPISPPIYGGGPGGTIGSPGLIKQAYQDFWTGTPVGTEINWAGGKLKRTGGGHAIYTGPDGKTIQLRPNSDLNMIAANNPNIGELWRKEFGLVPENFMTGASFDAYNYLMGGSKYPTNQPGILMDEFAVAALGFEPQGRYIPDYTTGKMKLNPNYKEPKFPGIPGGTYRVPSLMQTAYDDYWKSSEVGKEIDWAGGKLKRTGAGKAVYTTPSGKTISLYRDSDLVEIARESPEIAALWEEEFGFRPPAKPPTPAPAPTETYRMGGLSAAYAARGGMQSHLGDYSDGGRLLRGPGDGVSDSIPATIGGRRPARLADGEFVVPARIVSELGNGSTEAGARKLYAMMNRIQNNRRKSVGKGKVAVNSKSDKYLPA